MVLLFPVLYAKSVRDDIRADPATAELWRVISKASSESEDLRDLKLGAETNEAAVTELITRLRDVADMLETEVTAAELPAVEKELTEYVEKQSEAERAAGTIERKRDAAKAGISEKSAKLHAMKQRRLGNITSLVDDDSPRDVGLAGLFASPVELYVLAMMSLENKTNKLHTNMIQTANMSWMLGRGAPNTKPTTVHACVQAYVLGVCIAIAPP